MKMQVVRSRAVVSATNLSEDTAEPAHCQSSPWMSGRSPPTAGTPELRSRWPNTPLLNLWMDTQTHTHTQSSTHRSINMTFCWLEVKRVWNTEVIKRWQHLQVISQTVYGVYHGLSWWCHTAGKTDDDDSCFGFTGILLFICSRKTQWVCACAESTLTDLRLPPSASTPRQILKADAPFVV